VLHHPALEEHEHARPDLNRRRVAELHPAAAGEGVEILVAGRVIASPSIHLGAGRATSSSSKPERARPTASCGNPTEAHSCLSYSEVKQLYYQNPEFGFYFLKLTSERLFQSAAEAAGDDLARPHVEAVLGDAEAPALDQVHLVGWVALQEQHFAGPEDGYLIGSVPVMLTEAIQIPFNAWRLYEMVRLVRETERAASGDLSLDWLKSSVSITGTLPIR
jgi:hypothetical protein